MRRGCSSRHLAPNGNVDALPAHKPRSEPISCGPIALATEAQERAGRRAQIVVTPRRCEYDHRSVGRLLAAQPIRVLRNLLGTAERCLALDFHPDEEGARWWSDPDLQIDEPCTAGVEPHCFLWDDRDVARGRYAAEDPSEDLACEATVGAEYRSERRRRAVLARVVASTDRITREEFEKTGRHGASRWLRRTPAGA